MKSEEFETFTRNTLALIWNWTTHQNKSVIEAAYKALEEFNMSYFNLKMLPAYARVGIKLPRSLAATPVDAAKKPEDVLTYVPGEAWLTLVRNAKQTHWTILQSFVSSLVKREVSGLYKGIYSTAVQEARQNGIKGGEPLNYDFLKEYSTLRAVVRMFNGISNEFAACTRKEEGERLLNTVLIFLKAVGQPLHRPYPALNWSVLLTGVKNAVKAWTEKYQSQTDWNENIRHAIYDILAKQSNKSSSASSLITQSLTPDPSNELTKSDEVHLFSALDYLGRGIPPATLGPFIGYTLNKYLKDKQQLNLMLKAIKPVLTSSFIHDANRNSIGNAVEGLNDKIDPSDAELYGTYKSCVADLPAKHIERLTSPSLWWEVTDEKLFKAAVLRCHVAKDDPEEMALPWLNDIVDSAASMPGDRNLIMQQLATTLTKRCIDKETSAWFLQLLSQLLTQAKKKVADNMVANLEHNQRIIFYLDLLVLSLVIWSEVYVKYGLYEVVNNLTLLNDLLPSAVTALAERSAWASTLPQFMNFIVSSYDSIDSVVSGRYNLPLVTLLLASFCRDVNQLMWNKVAALYLANQKIRIG